MTTSAWLWMLVVPPRQVGRDILPAKFYLRLIFSALMRQLCAEIHSSQVGLFFSIRTRPFHVLWKKGLCAKCWIYGIWDTNNLEIALLIISWKFLRGEHFFKISLFPSPSLALSLSLSNTHMHIHTQTSRRRNLKCQMFWFNQFKFLPFAWR